MKVEINIEQRLEWLKKRILINPHEEEYLSFQLKDVAQDAVNQVANNFVLDPVIKRSFMVSYLGTDDQGQIVKGIEVVAENESRAIEKVLEINCAKEIYGAAEVIA